VVDGTGLLLLNGAWQGVPTWCHELLGDAKREVEALTGLTVEHVMVNIIPVGLMAPVHSDPDPGGRFERWHLPIQTNPKAWFQYADGDDPWPQHLEAGWWHGPVEYWRPHTVGNYGDELRMHLICDLR
jgi:hypothetical protein